VVTIALTWTRDHAASATCAKIFHGSSF
jgi:hypothetical protein